MWGIVPAAGVGSRIQPLAFSKELLPVGSRMDGGVERPRAVSEHLIERMIAAGADKICFVIAPGKSDIVNYYGARVGPAHIAYVVQPEPMGLCDAIFRARPFVCAEEAVVVGLPDTIWFPTDGLARLPDDELSFLLFPVDHPQHFDVVVTDAEGRVEEIQVKRPDARSEWVWGAFRMPARVLHELHALWQEPGRGDEYVGNLVNAYLARGGKARGIRAGEVYADVGTLHGYRRAVELLEGRPKHADDAMLPHRILQQRAALRLATARPDQTRGAVSDGGGGQAGAPARDFAGPNR
jgi:glucose-1-phosphate thymidylyltransferase